MKRRLRVLLAIGVVLPMILLSGCLFNIFQTAKMVQSGDVSVLIGTGIMPVTIDTNTAWSLTPQARLAVGLSDVVNLGLHTGALIPLSSGEPGWLGAMGDLKFSLIDNPESVSLAVGFGGGYGLHFLGWGVFGEVFLDVNVLPIFFAYQPTIPINGAGFNVLHDISAGLSLAISETARLMITIDTRDFAFPSYGIAFEIGF